MVETITAENLKERKDEFVIIDVRESDELAGRQIDGSVNIH